MSNMSDIKQQLLDNVMHWVDILEGKAELDEDYEDFWHFASESFLDIEYTYSATGGYVGSRVCVALGGPTVWIDTRHNQVEGYWGSESVSRFYTDEVGLGDYLEQLKPL